jgi:hypothetical protein
MSNEKHMGLHDAVMLEFDGEQVAVDLGVLDLVLWMNALPGVKTYSSCEGSPELCSPDAFVCFTCDDEDSLNAILAFVRDRASIVPAHAGGHRLSFADPENLKRLNLEKFPQHMPQFAEPVRHHPQ